VKDDSNHERGRNGPLRQTLVSASDVEAWFLREVLPLETSLMGYFKRNWRNEGNVRNLLIDRFRNLAVVPLETVGDVETLATPFDQPGPVPGSFYGVTDFDPNTAPMAVTDLRKI
jgi:hypothetical protein